MKRREFQRVTPESVGIDSRDLLELLDILENEENCEPHGLMIMRHGKICAEGWWAPYAKNIPHELLSMSKSYTATAVGIAYTEGLLDLDDPVIKYFPEYAALSDDAGHSITIRHLLTMSSGKAMERTDIADWIPHYFSMKTANTPGSHFLYSGEDTHMCIAAIERITGRRFEDYLAEKLCGKIGIDASNLHWGHLLNGSVVGCGGLSATVEDSLRLIKLYMDDGLWDGERILAHDYVRQAISSQIVPEPVGGEHKAREYGFQLWTYEGQKGRIFEANGGLGQCATAYPSLDMIVGFQEASQRDGVSEGIAKDILISRMETIVNNEILPENPAACGKLKRRLLQLNLGNPKSQPYSPVAESVSGKRYFVQEGSSLTFRKPLWKHMVLCEPVVYMEGMKWFSFDFTGVGTCRITFFESEIVRELIIGTDGMRRLNDYGNVRAPGINKVLLDGYWVEDTVFRVNARWIQTCYSISLDFRFLGKVAEISLNQINGDFSEHPMRREQYTAESLF